MAELTSLSSSSNASSAALLLDAADTLADIDQEARLLCGNCGPEAPLETPQALSEGAAAASVANLLARPANQAEADIAAARLAALVEDAQKTADSTPKPILPGQGTTSVPSTGTATGPVTSTITAAGELLPTTTRSGGQAVEDLVTGVTGTVCPQHQGRRRRGRDPRPGHPGHHRRGHRRRRGPHRRRAALTVLRHVLSPPPLRDLTGRGRRAVRRAQPKTERRCISSA